MGMSRRLFTKEFKLGAVRRLEQGVSIAEVARALEVNPNVLHRWRREFRQGPGNAFPGNGKQRWSEGRIAELERKIGQQALEIDFLKVLAAHRGTADAAGVEWKSAVYRKAEEEVKAGRGLTVTRMMELGHVSRRASTALARKLRAALIRIWRCATRFSALRWSGPAMVVRESRASCGGAVGG
jgi:transposase